MYETSKGVYAVGVTENSVQQIQFTHTLSSIVSKLSSPVSYGAKCSKSSDSELLVCFSSQDQKISCQTAVSELNFQDYKLPENYGPDAQLVYASKTKFVLKVNDNIVTFKQDGLNLIVDQTITSVKNFEIQTLNNEFYLVFAKTYNTLHSNQNELSFNVRCLSKEKPEHVVKAVSNEKSDDQLAILQFATSLVETKTGQFGLLTLCLFEDYSLVMFNTQGARYFTREEALSYISAVEMVDFPLSHLQEEYEDEFGHLENQNPISMFIKRIRTQTTQLKEFITTDVYNRVVNLINSNNPGKRSQKPQNTVLSVEDISRDEFNLNKIIVVATTVGKVYGMLAYIGIYIQLTNPNSLNIQSSPIFLISKTKICCH